MKRFIFLLVFFCFWAVNGQIDPDAPETFYNGIQLPNLLENKTPDSLVAINGEGVLQWVDIDNIGTGSVPTNLNDLSDVAASNPSTGQILEWNGTSWTAGTDDTGGSGATNLTGNLTGTTLNINSSSGTDASVDLAPLQDGNTTYTEGTGININGSNVISIDNSIATEIWVQNQSYLTSEVDGSITNEIELPIGGNNGQILSTDGTGNYTWTDDANTQLSEEEVENYINGNETVFSNWDKDATDDFSGNYSDLSGTPSIPQSNSDIANGEGYITGYTVTEADVTQHENALSIKESQITNLSAEANVQSDWTETNSTSDAYIINKPKEINFNIYNQNKNNAVTIIGGGGQKPILDNTSGTLAFLASDISIGASYIGRVNGITTISSNGDSVAFTFSLSGETVSATINNLTKDATKGVVINYNIDILSSNTFAFSGTIRIGGSIAFIPNTTLTIVNLSNLNFMIYSEMSYSDSSLTVFKSYLHRNTL